MKKSVTYKYSNGVSTINVDDGKANVMSVEMLTALNSAFDDAEKDNGVVLLIGRAGIFSAGFDLSVFAKNDGELIEMLTLGARTIERMMSFPTPIVAACTGHALAMGVFLLLAADYRVAIRDNIKISANEVAIGMTVPRFAGEICRFKLSPAIFNRAMTTAEYFSLEDALTGGFIDSLEESENLRSAATRKAEAFAQLDLGAHLATKMRIRKENITRMKKAVEADIADWKNRMS
ncbi:crotonase/enoyl-CoA hydratase family protein [Aurantivibrio infirmus]